MYSRQASSEIVRSGALGDDGYCVMAVCGTGAAQVVSYARRTPFFEKPTSFECERRASFSRLPLTV
jgi:hypothetical protein